MVSPPLRIFHFIFNWILSKKGPLRTVSRAKRLREKQTTVSPTFFVETGLWTYHAGPLEKLRCPYWRKRLNCKIASVRPSVRPSHRVYRKCWIGSQATGYETRSHSQGTVNTILQQAQPPTPNTTKEQQEALKSLKEDNSIMVFLADKGRASVILDADKYHAKMSALIDSGAYQLLNKDPTDSLTRNYPRSC